MCVWGMTCHSMVEESWKNVYTSDLPSVLFLIRLECYYNNDDDEMTGRVHVMLGKECRRVSKAKTPT